MYLFNNIPWGRCRIDPDHYLADVSQTPKQTPGRSALRRVKKHYREVVAGREATEAKKKIWVGKMAL